MVHVKSNIYLGKKLCVQSKFDNSFVELKMNNQTLDSEFASVSPGEVFKVDPLEDELVKRVMLLPLL